MTLELAEPVAFYQFWNMNGMFTGLGAIVIGSLALIIIIATTLLSCMFCKCCVMCRSCGCLKGCMEKCKRAPKEETPAVEGEAGADGENPEGDVEVEDFSYAPKPARTGRLRRAATGRADANASPPGSPARANSPGRARSFRRNAA